jgi:hypothetical protein
MPVGFDADFTMTINGNGVAGATIVRRPQPRPAAFKLGPALLAGNTLS